MNASCAIRLRRQFCGADLLCFKQHGIAVTARPSTATASSTGVLVPATALFTILTQVPDNDLAALGFIGPSNDPCNVILMQMLVLPPVSRPSMRTLLRTLPPREGTAGKHEDRAAFHSRGLCVATHHRV